VAGFKLGYIIRHFHHIHRQDYRPFVSFDTLKTPDTAKWFPNLFLKGKHAFSPASTALFCNAACALRAAFFRWKKCACGRVGGASADVRLGKVRARAALKRRRVWQQALWVQRGAGTPSQSRAMPDAPL